MKTLLQGAIALGCVQFLLAVLMVLSLLSLTECGGEWTAFGEGESVADGQDRHADIRREHRAGAGSGCKIGWPP